MLGKSRISAVWKNMAHSPVGCATCRRGITAFLPAVIHPRLAKANG